MKRKIVCLCLGSTLIFGNIFSVNVMAVSEIVYETVQEKVEDVQTADTEETTSVFETEVVEETVEKTEIATESATVEETVIEAEIQAETDEVFESQEILEISEAA